MVHKMTVFIDYVNNLQLPHNDDDAIRVDGDEILLLLMIIIMIVITIEKKTKIFNLLNEDKILRGQNIVLTEKTTPKVLTKGVRNL